MTAAQVSAPKARLKKSYNDSLATELFKDLNLKNIYEAPQLEKVILNVGLGRGKDDKKLFEAATVTLSKITGQRPVATIAKKSIAAFKLREGSKIGLKVTVRGERMYEFLDRLVNVVLPRLRDFHGVSVKSFDKNGNYSLGFIDQSVFPELTFEETTTAHGLQIIIVIRAKLPEHSRALLDKLGLPFEKTNSNLQGETNG